MRLDNVEVAIATFGSRIADALRLAGRLARFFDVIVIHQIPDGDHHGAEALLAALGENATHIRYIARREAGVTKSRNLALHMARRSFLWFLDDDVDIDPAACAKFFTDESWTHLDVVTITATRTDPSPGGSRLRMHNLVSILSVGTIQIIVRPERIRASGCRFPEDMGAGTDLPISDEPVFLACCLRQGLNVGKHPATLVSHPHESSGDRLLETAHCRARGLAFSRIFGPGMGYAFLLIFYLKHAPAAVSRHGLRHFFRGILGSIQGMRLA